jgi:ABC-type multidrug transport system fused ATPase/permease subunit
VAQNTLLLNGTVAENIAYGRHDATLEDMKKAATAARAEEFIENLPDGYDTVIGDQGIRLSGGQRQRLSLARTLLKDPPILVLDEATAMFDPEGEASFIEECHELLHQRTVVLITHRPASLALADRIIDMQPHSANGKATA